MKNKLRKGNKPQEQRKALANLNILFNGRNEAIKLNDDILQWFLRPKEAAEEQTKGTGLKLLTPKQML